MNDYNVKFVSGSPSPVSNFYTSILTRGQGEVIYSQFQFSTAPKWLADAGYYPTVFTDEYAARSWATTRLPPAFSRSHYLELWKVECLNEVPVPSYRLWGADLKYGEIRPSRYKFPHGTRMYKEIRLVARLQRFWS